MAVCEPRPRPLRVDAVAPSSALGAVLKLTPSADRKLTPLRGRPMALDVTDREAVFEAVCRAHERFWRLDVVVNNASYGQFGMVQELSEQTLGSRSRRTCSVPCG